ncbi:hypothetical protein [Paenibacillus graminis]|uniref:hypothetical protein n=2 Tax=Paenibacillus graminis TaxID=189425 RepID=UPI0012DEBB10|nr:hypothetical protein [Paenibacillus graminis]
MSCERSYIPMDKSKVIDAYRRGFLTVRECGQVLGVEERQLQSLLALEDDKAACLPPSRRIGS